MTVPILAATMKEGMGKFFFLLVICSPLLFFTFYLRTFMFTLLNLFYFTFFLLLNFIFILLTFILFIWTVALYTIATVVDAAIRSQRRR